MRVHGGYNPFDFGLSLAPGELHKTPALICGVTAKGWGGASLAMHRALGCRGVSRSDFILRDGVPYRSLGEDHFDAVLAAGPEIVLLGTGPTNVFPPRELVFAMARRQIGFDRDGIEG